MTGKLEQRHFDQLKTDGYTVIENVVPIELTRIALRSINAELGKGISETEANLIVNGICFPSLMAKPVISNLFNHSKAIQIAKQLIGKIHPVYGGQIALRFPGWGCADSQNFTAAPWWNKIWHIDGLRDPNQPLLKVKQGEINNFTCLLGVVLQDIPDSFHGNLVVYPGSHITLENHLKNNPQDLVKLEQEGVAALPKYLPLAPAKQVTAKAGDIVICHFQLAHSVSPNLSPHIRYMIYFRLYEESHKPETYRKETMTNIWLDWKGIAKGYEAISQEQNNQEKNRQTSNSANLVSQVEKLQIREPKVEKRLTEEEIFKLSRVAEEADKIYDQGKWPVCLTMYQELADNYDEDWLYQFKTAFCYAMTYLTENREKSGGGEKYARQSIHLTPDFVGGYCVLGRILVATKKYVEVINNMEMILEMPYPPKEFSWAKDLVVDSLRTLQEALFNLNRLQELQSFVNRLTTIYPDLKDKFNQVLREGEMHVLWLKGTQVMQKRPLNFAEGQPIFERLAEIDPQSYWANLHCALCITHNPSGDLSKGELYAKKSIELDPLCLCGYAILARNLKKQGRNEECISACEMILNCKNDGQHVDYLLDGIRSTKEAFAALYKDEDFDFYVAKFIIQFPHWKAQIDGVKNANCSIM